MESGSRRHSDQLADPTSLPITRAAQTALKLEQESHRKTRDEVAKARTALAFVRTQAAHDLKRKESETNRVLDRWQKASSELAKQQSSRSGLTLVNYVDSRGLALLQPLPEVRRRLTRRRASRRVRRKATNLS